MYTLPRSCTAVPPPDPMSRLHDPLSARSHDPLGRMVDPLQRPGDPRLMNSTTMSRHQEALSRSLCSPVLPRPLRTLDNKSNSLPRRRAISGTVLCFVPIASYPPRVISAFNASFVHALRQLLYGYSYCVLTCPLPSVAAQVGSVRVKRLPRTLPNIFL